MKRLPLHVLTNILLAYVCYECCRLAFLAENWSLLNANLTWGSFLTMSRGGLLFDTAAICFTNSLYLLLALLPFGQGKRALRVAAKWSYLIPNTIAVVANLMDSALMSLPSSRTKVTLAAS